MKFFKFDKANFYTKWGFFLFLFFYGFFLILIKLDVKI